MEGYCLIYRNQDGQKVWSKRWFTIRDNLLIYSRNPNDTNRRKINVEGAQIMPDSRRADKFQFKIANTPRGNYYLRAMSEADLEDWLADLKSAAGEDDDEYYEDEEEWDEEGEWDEEEWEEEEEEYDEEEE